MQDIDLLRDVEARLARLTIHELRQVARAVGVKRPADGKKIRIEEAVLSIARGETAPEPPSKRGAPPKSHAFDEKLVSDIVECRSHFLSSPKKGGKVCCEENPAIKYSGILYKNEKGYFLCTEGCTPKHGDVFVHASIADCYSLREGDFITGEGRERSYGDAGGLVTVEQVNGKAPSELIRRDFSKLTHIYPEVFIKTEHKKEDLYCRMTDMFAPLAFGQRAFVMAPPKSGRTKLLKSIATGICANYPDTKVVSLLIGELPEVVTDFKRSIPDSQLFYTTFDMPYTAHIAGAKLVFEYVRRLVEEKYDVVLIFDGVTRFAEALKASGGCREDIFGLLYSACNAEEGGSLTLLSTVTDGTGEFSPLADAVITLSPELARAGILPDIDVANTFTDECDKIAAHSSEKAKALRIKYSGDVGALIKLFKDTDCNGEIYG